MAEENMAEAKELEFTVAVEPVDLSVRAERRALSQVLLNLTNNAIKFTDKGHIRLQVRRRREGERTLTEFVVADTGIGIPEEKQRLIFEPFEQGDTSATRQYEGTGLGLAIASQLICLMGGQIWVQSAAGRGSTFHFTARLARCKTPAGVQEEIHAGTGSGIREKAT